MLESGSIEHALSGRVAVVTGASSGIGKATAIRLARLGAVVVVGARRVGRLELVARQITEAGGTAEALPLDVSDPTSAEAFAAEVRERHAGLDIVVNNAGLARGFEPVVESSEADWREMLEANVMGLMRMTRLLLPSLLERPHGDIVHVGSVAGQQPYARGAAYCASKAAVEAFVQALRFELLGTGIRQLVVQPGMVAETEFSEVRFHGDRERAGAVYRGVSPLSADDVADCIAFALTRPPHVNVQSLLVMPTAQASATAVARRDDGSR
jgi:NADP-dependent 3-hydroxy acid dehydrogenase YdfG